MAKESYIQLSFDEELMRQQMSKDRETYEGDQILLYIDVSRIEAYQAAAKQFGYGFTLIGNPGETAPYFLESKRRLVQPNERIVGISGITSSLQSYWKSVDALLEEISNK